MLEKVAIVVVTYKRQQLLSELFDSLMELETAPWRVVVVDNENASETADLVEAYRRRVASGSPAVAAAWPEGADSFVYAPQQENTGGSGGFYAGVKCAYEAGAEWFWLMDDDVTVMPDALEKLAKWAPRYGVVQGSRLDFDGGSFYWQYHFVESLGIYDPFATAKFDGSGAKRTNTACFEGGLFSRDVVRQIGFPDRRFFIYWDDCVYGYLASKVTESAVVEDVILRRAREVKNWEVTGTRQLNSSSDMTRFYIMRNRGYMARYLKLHGDYNPVGFALGTVLSFAKEFIRLATVDRAHFGSGAKRLVAGWQESRKIIHDATWQPMPKPE